MWKVPKENKSQLHLSHKFLSSFISHLCKQRWEKVWWWTENRGWIWQRPQNAHPVFAAILYIFNDTDGYLCWISGLVPHLGIPLALPTTQHSMMCGVIGNASIQPISQPTYWEHHARTEHTAHATQCHDALSLTLTECIVPGWVEKSLLKEQVLLLALLQNFVCSPAGR